MKEIKIIDLLNKIANGEIDYARRFDAKVGMNYCDINAYFERYPINENYLNVEIDLELLEEKKKIPEKLKSLNNVGNSSDIGEFKDKQQLNNHLIKDKLNEVIDYLDYLKIKGE